MNELEIEMPKVAPDVFDKQLTATLKVKGVKTMGDLVQHYKSLTEALDDNSGLGEMGKKHYDAAKNMTLRFKKRGEDFGDLKKQWAAYEAANADAAVSVTEAAQTVAKKVENVDETLIAITEIKSDKDLAVLVYSLITETFYNPLTGLWKSYDVAFDRDSFTSLGSAGWQTDITGASRELINKKKNEETSKLMDSDFVVKAINSIIDAIGTQVFGIRKKELRHGVRNHIRLHLYDLIYVGKL